MRERSLWTFHIAASGIVLILLGVHMVLMHLMGGEPLEWNSVAERMRSVAFATTYVLLLGAALYHGLYGLRNILLELGPRPALKRATNAVLLVGGLALFVFGAWAAIASLGAAETFGG
jgi:succinate dehydrogenase hydrophobic anchor subunit